MKKITILMLALISVLCLYSCSRSGCINSYSATMMLSSNGYDHCEVKFGTLKGTYSMKPTNAIMETDGYIHFEAELGEGELNVFYEIKGKRELLFNIKGGEHLDSYGGKISRGDKVKIFVEAVGTAKQGEVDIEFE